MSFDKIWMKIQDLDQTIQIVSLSNRYDRFVVANKMPPGEAWKKLQSDHDP